MRRLAFLGLLALSCNDLARFTTEAGQSYCGQISLSSVYREGFSPRVQMRLALDVAALESGAVPGYLTTYDSGLEQDQKLLDAAPLRQIEPLSHDSLSQLEFGDGRDRNLIFAVSPADPTAESLIAFVSLRSDDQVEVRLLRAGSSSEEVAKGRAPLFGVFLLGRRDGDCGF